SLLLSLPWELLDDGRGFLFQGNHSVRVRRRLPNRHRQEVRPSALPIRILLVSPRPEDAPPGYVDYIDHRISAKPLVEAVAELGALATVTLLISPTFPALQQELTRAARDGQPYDVVHFDGHGIYNARVGLGQLCFEDPKDNHLLDGRAMQPIDAAKLAAEMRAHRIPLVFLEACQSAKSDDDPTTSVAAKLLEEGVTSVVAMTHSVLVETARRFVEAFYQELARGARVGTAMLAGQHALFGDTYRGKVAGAGDLNLQDWFVPVLFQEAQDPRLLTQLPSNEARQLQAERRRLSLGRLPTEPPHTFIGRSRELLRLERLLLPEAKPELRYAVVRGVGGEGKTTLAAELARWLVATNRFERAAFVSFDPNDPRGCSDARSLLDSLGQQLLPEGERWSVAEHEWKVAVQQVERALRDHPTILVLDNLESVLPTPSVGADLRVCPDGDESNRGAHAGAPLRDPADEVFALCQTLLRAQPATRIVFTSREPLPAPFDHPQRDIPLGQLSREDAVELVSQVVRSQHRSLPEAEMPGGTAQAITDLVETANRHARVLVRLTQELTDRELREMTYDLREVMAALERRHPGDRENSLYASVELSLRRLPLEIQRQVKAMGVFHGGAYLGAMQIVLGIDLQTALDIGHALVDVGLAEEMPCSHLRFDPALPSYLLRQINEAEQEQLRARWAEAMTTLTNFLYWQLAKDAQLAASLTRLELPNLLAMLAWVSAQEMPERIVDLAGKVESLFANLGRPQALAQATAVRARAQQQLTLWGHARFIAESASIDRMWELGLLPDALIAAHQLLSQCRKDGADAYAEAMYDLAKAHAILGRAHKKVGEVEAALPMLSEAGEMFKVLAERGSQFAELMAVAVIAECAECLIYLGRLDEAAATYEETIKCSERLADQRSLAVDIGQLGTVRMLQGRHDEALRLFVAAKKFFEDLGEPHSVAFVLQRIAISHRQVGEFDQAECAYRQSLAIWVQQNNPAGEAATLGELGTLYDAMGRLDEAATFATKAAEIHVQLREQMKEGFARNNLAHTLIKLQRHNEARNELCRALECKRPFGHSAQIWTTWAGLHDVEQALGHAQAAAEARGQAVVSYLAYRRAGGESQANAAPLYALVAQAIEQGTTTEAATQLAEYARPDAPAWLPRGSRRCSISCKLPCAATVTRRSPLIRR
nr:CHAT domain-containing protein [Acidobacteriota bacterium]